MHAPRTMTEEHSVSGNLEKKDINMTLEPICSLDTLFKVVLFPLSLCPRRRTRTGFFFLRTTRSLRSCSSISSLTRLASRSARRRSSRSAGVSSGGGCRARESGSSASMLCDMENDALERPRTRGILATGNGQSNTERPVTAFEGSGTGRAA